MNDNLKVGIILIAILLIISFLVAFAVTFSSNAVSVPNPFGSDSKNVALIKVEGPITTEDQTSFLSSGSSAASDRIVELIKRAGEDKSIDAVYFLINSPGGTVVASEEIGNAVKKLNKSSVSFIREVGASGGYWVASATDYIIADPMSVTGSIGVTGSYLSYSDLLKRFNITYEELKGGQYKEIGSPMRKLSPEEKAVLQQRIDIIHQAFIKEVADNRELSYDYVKNLSTGMFYLGSQAKELGLVDELGDRDSVDAYLKTLLNTTKINYVEYTEPSGFLAALTKISANSFYFVGRGIASVFIEKEEFVLRAQI
jgi:protease-4